MAQPSGWGSTQNAAALPVVDAFARNMLMRYGGRTDDIWSYHDMPGYKRELGGATSAPGSDWASGSGGGSVRISGMGNGGTPSDPGGYNYSTLKNVASGATSAVRMGINASRTLKRASDQNKARKLQDTQRAYTNAWNPGMNYSYAYQQAASGQGQPIQQGGPSSSKLPSLGAPGTMPVVGPVSNIKNPQNPIEAANKGIMEWRKGKASSKYPNPTDPSEAANKGIGDMLRAQQAKAQSARLSSTELYKTNKSMREMFPNFYKNK